MTRIYNVDANQAEIVTHLEHCVGNDVTLEGAKEQAQEIFKELVLSCIESELEIQNVKS